MKKLLFAVTFLILLSGCQQVGAYEGRTAEEWFYEYNNAVLQIETLQAEKDDLQYQLDDMQTQIEDWQSQYDDLDSEKSDLEDKISDLEDYKSCVYSSSDMDDVEDCYYFH